MFRPLLLQISAAFSPCPHLYSPRFRLDLPNGLSLGVDRVADRRVAFIKQRWTAGPFRNSSSCSGSAGAGHCSLQGDNSRSLCWSWLNRSLLACAQHTFAGCRCGCITPAFARLCAQCYFLWHFHNVLYTRMYAGGRQLRVTAPLSAKDTLDLQDAHREALALIEAASMGVGGFLGALDATALLATTNNNGSSSGAAAAGELGGGGGRASVAMAAASLVARQERALKWSQGVLAKALEARDASFRCVFGSLCVSFNEQCRQSTDCCLVSPRPNSQAHTGRLRCGCAQQPASSAAAGSVVATRLTMLSRTCPCRSFGWTCRHSLPCLRL